MSKIISTSGAHPPLMKGAGPAGEGTGDGASALLFASLFGGMKLAEGAAEPDEMQPETGNADPAMTIDPHLVQMLAAAGKGRLQADAVTKGTTADDEAEDAGLSSLTEPEDKAAEAGLLSAQTLASDQRLAGKGTAQNAALAAIAEDLKQASAHKNAQQTGPADGLSDQDPEFIGPPAPRATIPSATQMAAQTNQRSELAQDMARLRTAAQPSSQLSSQAAAQAASHAATTDEADFQLDAGLDGGVEELAIDAAKLKADRGFDSSLRTVSGSSTSAPAHQAELPAGLTSGGGQNGFSQGGGQQSGTGSAFTGTLSADSAEQWLDILDMQDENWTDQLVRRIDREMRSGGNGLDLELNPRNLGRLRVNLSVAQDQTNVVLRTETGAAAQMITDAEGRLSQMLEQAGLKLGQFDAFSGGQDRSFGQHKGQQGQSDNHGQLAGAEPETERNTGDTAASDGLVNLTA
ncbi:Flagellar hook-length control protein [SAR116 cluster alpha proteobacterium HIMB100]|nr:Flagellar hook-length control protein [SAR116 cluster alpha proteobacterium HIMB100]